MIFSIVPLVVVSVYALHQFQRALESEQIQRLQANGREIELILSDYYTQLRENRDTLSASPQFTYGLTVMDVSGLREFITEWIGGGIVSSLAVYGRDGQRLALVVREDDGKLSYPQLFADKASLSEQYINHLADRSDLGVINQQPTNGLELVLFSKMTNQAGNPIGYIEQKIPLRTQFLVRIKNKLKLELMLLDDSEKIISSTFYTEKKNLSEVTGVVDVRSDDETMLRIESDGVPYGFILYPLHWDGSSFLLGLGMSRKSALAVLENVNVAFIGLISLVALFLTVTIVLSTTMLLRPIKDLIEGLKSFEKTDKPVQLKVKNKTEIGRLTSTFNQMSLKIFQARQDLKKKIKELERANSNLKEAQAKLVHSAKMTSLGQLVAGVAHELNNPIGFIYSNMSHLQDYTEKLFHIIEEIEKDPSRSSQIKQENEFEYIKKDLPQLINSCHDGAQRTRDIVLGLRNFSRLEESQLKEIDLRDSIDTTLDLLKGEIKNRVRVHRNYESIPKVNCYASQINQVIMNIIANAIHAVGGNGQIWISTTALKAAQGRPGQVRLTIQDSGIGMEPEVVEKIFEPFFTTKEVGQGTGLGLSISYGIIQRHGGDIQVRSQKGKGTEFVITIPVSQPKKPPLPHDR